MTRIRLTLAIVAALLVSGSAAFAQTSLTSATCPGSGCITFGTAGMGTIGVQIVDPLSGTWASTVEVSNNGRDWTALRVTPPNSTTAVTTQSAAGQWTGAVAGFAQTRVRLTSYTSGNPTVYFTAASGGGGSAGGGAATASLTLQEADDASIAAGQTADAVIPLNMAFDGTVWRRVTFGTAGTPSSQVWSFQGVSGGTAMPASQSGTWSVRTQDGSGTAITSSTEGSLQPMHVALVDPSTNALATLGGACTLGSFILAASENETAIKASSGYLDGLWIASIASAPLYAKLYNDTTTNVSSASTPVARFMTPANSTAANGAGNNLVAPAGAYFSTAITIRVVTGIADNDATNPTASTAVVTYCYR